MITLFASCGEIYDLNGFDWEPDTPPSDSVFNREIQVLDWGLSNLPEGHRPLDDSDPMLFSLEKFSTVHIAYKSSERWDISIGGLGGLSSNNGGHAGVGYGSSAVGGLLLLDSAYSQVTSVPEDNRFSTPGNAGLDNFNGSGLGYIYYTFFGNAFRPDMVEWSRSSDPDKAATGNRYLHMMYCLSEDLARTFPGLNSGYYEVRPKTIIVRTANGNYVKLEMQSYYKGTLDPREMRRGTDMPGGYMSFRYMVIRADERRFGFVARRPPLTVDLTNKKITVGEENVEHIEE
ncbi:HmuY family protein [Parapedobacter koreensis]|nr:HmuY family protein [Parapedobacter koreensis]